MSGSRGRRAHDSRVATNAAASALGATVLQVPVYAAVAARRLEAPATGTYLPFQARDLAGESRRVSARVNAEDRVADLARRVPGGPSEIERRVLEIVEGARRGAFAPIPAREAECTHCGVSGGCRKPRFAMAPEIDEEEEREGS